MRHRGRNIFIPARKALEIVAHELGGRADREVGLLLFFFRAFIYGGAGGGGDDDRAHHDANQHKQQRHQHGSAPLAIQFSADRLHFRHLPFC